MFATFLRCKQFEKYEGQKDFASLVVGLLWNKRNRNIHKSLTEEAEREENEVNP